MPLGGAERAAQSDLGAALEDADEHDVGDADGADEQRDGAEAEEETVERALRVGAGGERGGGLADVDLVRRFGVGGGAEHRLDGRRLARHRADVDRRRMAVEAEVALRGGEADEDARVDLGGERGGVEDAGEVEPHAAEPDALARVERSMPSRCAAASPSTATGSRAVAALR